MNWLLWYFIAVTLLDGLWFWSKMGRPGKTVTGADVLANSFVAAAHIVAFAWILGQVG